MSRVFLFHDGSWNRGCNSVVECLLRMLKVLGSNPSSSNSYFFVCHVCNIYFSFIYFILFIICILT